MGVVRAMAVLDRRPDRLPDCTAVTARSTRDSRARTRALRLVAGWLPPRPVGLVRLWLRRPPCLVTHRVVGRAERTRSAAISCFDSDAQAGSGFWPRADVSMPLKVAELACGARSLFPR